MAREYPTVLDLVGGTPLVRLQRVGSDLAPTLLAKLGVESRTQAAVLAARRPATGDGRPGR